MHDSLWLELDARWRTNHGRLMQGWLLAPDTFPPNRNRSNYKVPVPVAVPHALLEAKLSAVNRGLGLCIGALRSISGIPSPTSIYLSIMLGVIEPYRNGIILNMKIRRLIAPS